MRPRAPHSSNLRFGSSGVTVIPDHFWALSWWLFKVLLVLYTVLSTKWPHDGKAIKGRFIPCGRWQFLMHTGIMLHMQVSPHITVSTYKCYISSPCVKLPWFLKLWWDWYHLISGLFTSLLSVRQLGSLCSTERNRHLEGALPVLFACTQGQEESGSGYIVFSPLTVRGVQSFVLGQPFQHPILLLPLPLVSPCIPGWLQLAQETRVCRQHSQPHHVSRNTQCCSQRAFLKVGQAATHICGKGRDSGICHGQPKDWNPMVQNILDKPSTEPHSTPVCSAIISSCFYRLVFFFLNCEWGRFSLLLFRPFKSPHLVCLKTSLSKVSPKPLTLQSPLETGPMPPVLSWPCLLLEDDRAASAPSYRESQDTGKLANNPNPPWECVQTDLAMSLASQSSGRNTTTSKCKTRREEDGKTAELFRWSEAGSSGCFTPFSFLWKPWLTVIRSHGCTSQLLHNFVPGGLRGCVLFFNIHCPLWHPPLLLPGCQGPSSCSNLECKGRGAELQRARERHSFMDHVSQDMPCPQAA